MDEMIRNVGKRLVVVQKMLNKSNQEMASIVCNDGNVRNYLKIKRGEIRITEDKLLLLHRDYGVNLDYLLTGNEEKGIILKQGDLVSEEEVFLMGYSNIKICLENNLADKSLGRMKMLLKLLTDTVGAMEIQQ